MEPASIRFNNPGAMWGGNAIARRWGATANVALADGTKEHNTIAFFPDKVHGAAAQLDLWRRDYCNRSLQSAITKWSGGNSSAAYMEFLQRESGLTPETIITPALLESAEGLSLMKAQARWEAGRVYPMSDEQWVQAQRACFSTKQLTPVAHKKAGAVVATGAATATAAAKAASTGNNTLAVVLIVVGIAVAVSLYVYFHNKG